MQKTKKREWVKTAAIIFLSVLLVLTFFSNTIRNRSLPEVAAKYVESGSINAKIRGTGAVSANEVYEVMLSQTRKIESVLVRVGDEVKAGDPLFKLESMDSDELKQAKEQLRTQEIAYQKGLIEQGNAGAEKNHEIQKLRDDYNEKLRIYQVYSTMDPSQVDLAVRDAENDLRKMTQEKDRIANDLKQLQDKVTEAETDASVRLTNLKKLEDQIETDRMKLDSLTGTMSVLNQDRTSYASDYAKLEDIAKAHGAGAVADKMAFYANNPAELEKDGSIDSSTAAAYIKAYDTLNADLAGVMSHLDHAPKLDKESNFERKYDAVSAAVTSQRTTTEQNLELATREHDEISKVVAQIEAMKSQVTQMKDRQARVETAVQQQQEVVDNYKSGKDAADALKQAQDALEEAVFKANLGDGAYLDTQKAKEDIEELKKTVEKLQKDADGAEVTAKVSGTISAINATAGATAGADQAIATITVADRGYVVKVPVTVEQSRQVRIGDTAEVTNYYWGDIKATLENIAADPDSGGKGKLLIFRITGEGVEAGSNLTLSIGQKSTNYDCLIPKSAIRSDSNGSFVLVVTAKSSPLGNRYIATRADVQVLAEDDTKAAVSGLAYGDFVITTSTKPLEAGDMVRLVENG